MLVLCVGVLWAGSLSAQDTTLVVLRGDTTIVSVNVSDNDSTFIRISVDAAQQSLNDGVAALPCDQCGGMSAFEKSLWSTAVGGLLWFVYEYRQRTEKLGPDVFNEGDTNVEVEVPDHTHGHGKKRGHDGEG